MVPAAEEPTALAVRIQGLDNGRERGRVASLLHGHPTERFINDGDPDAATVQRESPGDVRRRARQQRRKLNDDGR